MKLLPSFLSHRSYRAAFFSGLLGLLMALILLLVMQPGPSAATQPVSVGLIPDEAGIYDGGWNWLSYQGLLRAEDELGVVGTVYTSTGTVNYGQNLQDCVDDGNDLCISVGILTAEAISVTARANPDTSFAIIDVTWDSYPDNLRGMTFAGAQAGYLAGALAGLMTESDVVGAVGGMEIPPVAAFVEPYRYASQCVNPAATPLITYTGDFFNPEVGAAAAQEMIAQGADAIFGVGGRMGNGAVLTATQSGVWGIGVDADQYYTLFMSGTVPGAEYLLTSAMKRLDNAVFNTIGDVISGTFTAGTLVYDLTTDGVGLAPFHEADPAVSQAVRDRLAEIEQGIIDGSIDVNAPCPVYQLFLPAVMRKP